MIPKIIWQTYEVSFDELPQYIKDCAQTWKDNNPEWEYRYVDAKERDKFVLNNFDQEWYNIFTKLPYGVLKADIWRYMIMYIYGGVYADLDTLCKGPIEVWLKNDMNSTFFIDHNNEHFCQFILSSVPKNIIYMEILELIKNKFNDKEFVKTFLNKTIKDFTFHFTGNLVCTEAIRNFLKIPKHFHLIYHYEKVKILKNLEINKFFYYGKESQEMLFNYPIEHLMGSNTWNKDNYIQWHKQDFIGEQFL